MDQAFPSDLTHEQWKFIEALLPKARDGGRPRTTNLRAVVNAVLFLNRTGCQWRYLPKQFPPWQTVYDYYSKWIKSGVWFDIYFALYFRTRLKENRSIFPTLAVVDSQSVRAHFGEARAKDCYKKVIGRKRSILVDSLGLLLCVCVHKANDQDFAGMMKLFEKLPEPFNRSLERILADKGYRFSTLREEALSRGIELETIDRKIHGTNLKPKRWIVERTFAWFNHYRRLSRDFEKSCGSSETMLFVSQIQLLLRRAFRCLLHTAWRTGLLRHPPAAQRWQWRLTPTARRRPRPPDGSAGPPLPSD